MFNDLFMEHGKITMNDIPDYYEEVLLLRKKVSAYEDGGLVVKSLQEYYEVCSTPDKIDCEDLLLAIELVLKGYMNKDEYEGWLASVRKTEIGEIPKFDYNYLYEGISV